MRISDWSSDVCSSDLFIGRIDTANAADDPKFSDVLHGSLLWISVADGFFAAELSHAGKLKMGGSACGNPRPKAGFLLARISGAAQFVSVRQQRPKERTETRPVWTECVHTFRSRVPQHH